ncbi:MAG: hypothetical protein ACRBHB_07510 [Arenicella sp.]
MTTEKTTNQSRRKILTGSAIAGVSAAAIWHKPILQSVVLPAHAQTSVVSPALPASFFGANVTAQVVDNHEPFSPLDLFIGPVHAGRPTRIPSFNLQATLVGTDSYAITLINQNLTTIRQGTLNVDGTPGLLTTTETCPQSEGGDFDIPATIQEVGDTMLLLQIQRQNGDFLNIEVTPGSGSLPALECIVPG